MVQTLCCTGTLPPTRRRKLEARSMGLFGAVMPPCTFNRTNEPMSPYFNALPSATDGGVPLNTLKRDNLAWRPLMCSSAPLPPRRRG